MAREMFENIDIRPFKFRAMIEVEGKKKMAGYRKESFDKCLRAIVSEFWHIEEDCPAWPDNVVDAARVISDKASKVLSASATLYHGSYEDKNQMLREALQTGALVLRFLLNVDDRQSYEMATIDEFESPHDEGFD